MENTKQLILDTLKEKTNVKDKVFNNTWATFRTLRSALKELSTEYNEEYKDEGVEYFESRNKTRYETEMRVASDLLIFQMHTSVFEFDRAHTIWNTSYVQDNRLNSFVGVINIYNFINDSFKYNRSEDLGYLIGRIFINKDLHYFVEGKRQLAFLYNDFANSIIDRNNLKNIINSSILYCLDFGLLVPPYDNVKVTTVGQMQEKLNSAQSIGKRLGFKFYADDDSPEL